jgi:NADPH-dependent glutamate synthase beta subunit-like oxidoreductase
VAPCNEGCPVGIDIEAYMNLLREGHIDAAIGLLLRENPMPAVTGRVCYHPCETTCNRRRHDGAVAIHSVERLLGDEALKLDIEPAPRIYPEHVAIVGSGPAGLSAAYHLARLGYGVTIFEGAPEPGGVLRLGIPEYRLPKDVLANEIKRITALGIEIKCNARVGTDPSWDSLDAFDAVFLAMGVHKSQPLGIPGENVEGIRSGLAFLKDVNFCGRPEIGPRVIVVGGGNTAMDCARTALRLGNDVEVLSGACIVFLHILMAVLVLEEDV